MAPNKAQQIETGAMPQETNHENREGTARLAGSPGAFVFASAFGPRIPLSPPDDGGSGGGGEGGAGGDEGAGGDGGQGGAGGEGGEGGAQPPARPDYLPENLWDAEKGFKSEDFNALVARDAERQAELAQVPETADKYEAKLPHDFKIEGMELADGESALDENDPRIAGLRELAHANKWSQSQFEGVLALGVQMDFAEGQRLQEAQNRQVDLLGAKGKERVGAVKSWVSAKLPADQAEAILGTLYTAKQIEAMEAIMRMNRGTVPGTPGAARQIGRTEISDEEYNKMSTSERINYARQQSKK